MWHCRRNRKPNVTDFIQSTHAERFGVNEACKPVAFGAANYPTGMFMANHFRAIRLGVPSLDLWRFRCHDFPGSFPLVLAMPQRQPPQVFQRL
jgi:hypothetical protein